MYICIYNAFCIEKNEISFSYITSRDSVKPKASYVPGSFLVQQEKDWSWKDRNSKPQPVAIFKKHFAPTSELLEILKHGLVFYFSNIYSSDLTHGLFLHYPWEEWHHIPFKVMYMYTHTHTHYAIETVCGPEQLLVLLPDPLEQKVSQIHRITQVKRINSIPTYLAV